MPSGGKYKGAGRPKGSTTKPQLRDFIDKEEVQKIINEAKKKAKQGDTNMLKFILEQIFGKAPQNLDLTTDGKELKIIVPQVVAESFNINGINEKTISRNQKQGEV